MSSPLPWEGPAAADKGRGPRGALSLLPSVCPGSGAQDRGPTMAQLVECVPNFSEGNNQQVRGGGGLRARRGVLRVGLGSGSPLSSAMGRSP